AGGVFTTVDGVEALGIAKWNEGTWSALSPGMYGVVAALTTVGGERVCAGGSFTIQSTAAGGGAANHIAKWNGRGWSALGSGLTSRPGWPAPRVHALAVSGRDLYVGGYFSSVGGVPATNIARWNGSSWSALGSGMDEFGYVLALAVSGSGLYAGGYFTNAGGTAVNHIARWDGSNWSALGLGMGGSGPLVTPLVYALAASGS